MRFDRDTEPIATLGQLSQQSSAEKQVSDKHVVEIDESRLDPQSSTPNTFATELQPRGTETRLGQSLDYVLRLYRDKPLAGIVVLTDGAQNAGVEPTAAMRLAHELQVPFYTIGLGSAEPQRNVAMRDIVVPTRAFPGDTVDITGYLQGHGFANREVIVELHRRRDVETEVGVAIATERVLLGKDGEMAAVSFIIEPDQVGTFVYELRVLPPDADANARDNSREAEVEVVDRQTKVLLFASGPMRSINTFVISSIATSR